MLYKSWSVALECEIVKARRPFTEAMVEQLIEALDYFSPAISFTPTRINLRLSVGGITVDQALESVVTAYGRTAVRLHLPATTILRAEVELESELDRVIAEPNLPTLVGIAEIAHLLHVSRQRASELAQSAQFPRPLLTLSAGPIWLLSTIQNFQRSWERKSGRPLNTPERTAAIEQLKALRQKAVITDRKTRRLLRQNRPVIERAEQLLSHS